MLLLQMQLNKQATKERLSLATVSVISFQKKDEKNKTNNENLFRKLHCSCNANKTLLCFAGIWLPDSSCGSHWGHSPHFNSDKCGAHRECSHRDTVRELVYKRYKLEIDPSCYDIYNRYICIKKKN